MTGETYNLQSEVQTEAIEWAERNNFDYFTDYPNDGYLLIKMSEFKQIFIDPNGGVDVERRKVLCGEWGEMSFGEKRMTVTDEKGNTYYISEKQFPL